MKRSLTNKCGRELVAEKMVKNDESSNGDKNDCNGDKNSQFVSVVYMYVHISKQICERERERERDRERERGREIGRAHV